MIEAYALHETAVQLRAAENWVREQCDVMPNGQPHPTCGEFFVGIFGSESININNSSASIGCISADSDMTIRITKRMSAVPFDRWSENFVKTTLSLATLATRVRKRVLEKQALIFQKVNENVETDFQRTHDVN